MSQARRMAPQPVPIGPRQGPERPLRSWQRSALARYLAAAPRDFLAVASPGAGLGSTARDISRGDTQGGHT